MSKQQIKDALDNAEAYINQLASLPDTELAERLDIVHEQMELAERKRNTESLDLLEIWRSQIIEARLLKQEDNIPDAPNAMEEAIAHIETVTAQSVERKELFASEETEEESVVHKAKSRKPAPQPNPDSQMNLF